MVGLRLARLLYKRGYTRQGIQDLLRFLDWILRLPEDLEKRIMEAAETLEHGKRMPFLSNIERWSMERGHKKGKEEGKAEGKQEGLAEGLHEAIAIGLELRFGTQALELLPRVRKIQAAGRLRTLLRRLKTAKSLMTFRAALERM
jgi:flagellar biosynthesis/type III secretory pathway protein FliH